MYDFNSVSNRHKYNYTSINKKQPIILGLLVVLLSKLMGYNNANSFVPR